MPIVNVKNITPKKLRGVVPDKYRNLPYRELKKGDKVVIDSCVFSIYPARDKETRQPLTIQNGPNAGKTINNCTVYFGLGDGCYTSLKNDVVESQMCALTGFDTANKEVGYYDFTFDPETVECIEVTVKMGQKDVPAIAFQQ